MTVLAMKGVEIRTVMYARVENVREQTVTFEHKSEPISITSLFVDMITSHTKLKNVRPSQH